MTAAPESPPPPPPRRGEIYDVDFGTPRGSEQAGRRPAVVVSNDINNRHGKVVIVAAITKTVPTKAYPFNVDLPAGILELPGTIYCGQLLTIDKTRLMRNRGTLDATKLDELNRALAVAIGLPKAWTQPPPPAPAPASE